MRTSRVTFRSLLGAWYAVCALTVSASAYAAPEDEAFKLDESEVPSEARGPRSSRLLRDEQALEEERAPEERFRETTDPHEERDKTYVFFGLAYRYARVPEWLLPAYHVKQGPGGLGMPVSFSGELAYRKNGFQVTGGLNFSKFYFHGPFQLKGDPITDTEWLNARFKLLNLTVAATWSTSFTDWFAVEYGIEGGLGVLFGDLVRNEAYRNANGTWGKCETWASQTTNPNDILYNPKFPNPTPQQKLYCDPPVGPANQPPPATNTAEMRGAQYGVTARHGLFHGGVPHVIPIVGPRLSLRFKPIHQVVLRVDLPVPVLPFGFMGGISAQYGL